jgi:hypothetical protein
MQTKRKEDFMTPTKTVNFAFRLTPADKRKLQSLADKAGLTMTEYILRSALNKPITIIPGLDEFSRQLKAIGNNLNQLTYRANAGQTRVVDLHDTQETLAALWACLGTLTKKVK